MCGWGTGTTNELESVTGTCSVSSSIKRTQTYAFRVNPTTTATGHAQLRGFSAAGAKTNLNIANAYIRYYLYIATAPAANSEEIMSVNTGITDKLTVRLNADRTLALYDTTPSQIGSDSATAIPLNTWVCIEVLCGTGIGATATLRINGIQEITGTATLTANAASVKFGKVANRNGQTIDVYYDDAVVDNASWPGEGRVFYLVANAAGTYSSFTGTYADAAEIPWSDAEYLVSSGVATEAETWNHANYSGLSSGKVGAVLTLMRVIRDGGSSGALQCRRRVGGTDYDTSSSLSVGSTAVLLGQVDATKPGGGAWTASAIDSMETGAVEASANASRILGSILAVSTREPSPGTASGGGISKRLAIGIGIGM